MLRHREQRDVVAAVVVALEVEVARSLGDDGEGLEGHVALQEPRHVDVAARRAVEQVAGPQQRVGMEVGDEEPLVQAPRGVRNGRARPRDDRVDPSVRRIRGQEEEGADHDEEGDGRGDEDRFQERGHRGGATRRRVPFPSRSVK